MTPNPTPATATADAGIRAGTLVHHNGEQVTGTITNVDPDTALHWLRHHWATWVWVR